LSVIVPYYTVGAETNPGLLHYPFPARQGNGVVHTVAQNTCFGIIKILSLHFDYYSRITDEVNGIYFVETIVTAGAVATNTCCRAYYGGSDAGGEKQGDKRIK
jgi:hypothetical protein